MSNETKPLLSEVLHIDANMLPVGSPEKTQLREYALMAEEMEADRSKLMAVLQVCADALATEEMMRRGYRFKDDGTTKLVSTAPSALSQLKAIGVEPNK